MTEVKRNIDPNNKPGPKPVEGTNRDRTVILKLTNASFEDVNWYIEKHNITKSDFYRDAGAEIIRKEKERCGL